jgi:hypothetical protein
VQLWMARLACLLKKEQLHLRAPAVLCPSSFGLDTRRVRIRPRSWSSPLRFLVLCVYMSIDRPRLKHGTVILWTRSSSNERFAVRSTVCIVHGIDIVWIISIAKQQSHHWRVRRQMTPSQ